MAEGWMWSSTQPVAVALRAGQAAYVHRHCRYPMWVRLRMEMRQELTEQDVFAIVSGLNLAIVTDETIPPNHFLFGRNGGGQDTKHEGDVLA